MLSFPSEASSPQVPCHKVLSTFFHSTLNSRQPIFFFNETEKLVAENRKRAQFRKNTLYHLTLKILDNSLLSANMRYHKEETTVLYSTDGQASGQVETCSQDATAHTQP